jgi:hypothetical protein
MEPVEPEITDVIADLVRQANPELDARLESQAEALREHKCTEPLIGKWVDANDVKYLLSTFDLPDEDFAERFPKMANIKLEDRRRVAAAIESHFEQCTHCSLKRGYDLELDAQIKRACRENNALLLELLGEEEAVPAGEGDREQLILESTTPALKEI